MLTGALAFAGSWGFLSGVRWQFAAVAYCNPDAVSLPASSMHFFLRRVKCFVNGMRWGFSLPPAAVQTRASLAAALSKGLATELTAPPGRGERLHVVFVDPDGRISEFPPSMEAGWKTAATSSSRVYIKPGSPVR